ncbi:Vta1 like-domain-containing protein [Zopfochytrium polystomum]|nr:Vta1 like-domain-containing protein [Zopfochytrium polystomum]
MGLSNEVPEDLKFISGFLQRAEELQTRDPVVSYYCNYYAAKLAIERNAQSHQSQAFLMNLLDVLEKEKAGLGPNDAITNDLVGYAHVENFALKIFNNADNQDRAGAATNKTAKTFLAASIFLEVLKVFGTVEDSINDKIKYARFKAVDIIKAIKEGRKPTPGPAVDPSSEGAASEAGPSSPTSGGGGARRRRRQPPRRRSACRAERPTPPPAASSPSLPPPPSAPSFYGSSDPLPPGPGAAPPPLSPNPLVHPPQHQPPQPPLQSSSPPASFYAPQQPQPPHPYAPSQPFYQPPSAPQPPVSPSVSAAELALRSAKPAPSPYAAAPAGRTAQANALAALHLGGANEPDPQVIAQATKFSKFAISALQYDDINTAIDNLEKAAALLRPYRK